uniref:Ubiquitin-like 1-activating enzyme E1A n=1 Tax=Albugo laibachii Nc14 TaxID=890382 RepID=F0WU28_9STRA|nr:SUMOactivating enzyme (SAE) putative [Albugo laibachii Nc14]|eukprot:CCA24873.1 SUMOactivating enzyme (SAE) putative [Albugo laibachii Nc14]
MSLSSAEAAVYDRQMRLWGVEAQHRLQKAQVFIGGLSIMGSELSKNLVLSGINITLQDDLTVSSDCIESQFLFSSGDFGRNRAVAALPTVKELNPLVHVRAETRALEDLEDSYFSGYSIVCVIDASMEIKASGARLDAICRVYKIAFLALHTSGFYASMFVDLGPDFIFRRQMSSTSAEKPDEKKGWSQPCHVSYPSFKEYIGTRWNSLLNRKKRGPPTPLAHIRFQLLHTFQASRAIRCGALIPKDFVEDFVAFSQQKLIGNGLNQDFFSATELSAADVQIAPVCAILAGIAGREIVKIISQQDEPICNVFLFDGSTGLVARIGSSLTHATTRPQETLCKDRNVTFTAM